MHATCWRSEALRHSLTPSWSLELPDDGEGSVTDDGELLVEAPGRSIVLATWEAAEGVLPAEMLNELQSAERPEPIEEFTHDATDGTLRWAVLLDEDDDGTAYQGLYGYVLAQREWLQVAVLFDHADDLEEALHIWRSVAHSDVPEVTS